MNTTKWHCDVCDISICQTSMYAHLKSEKHNKKVLTIQESEQLTPPILTEEPPKRAPQPYSITANPSVNDIYCETCGGFYKKNYMPKHLETEIHKINKQKKQEQLPSPELPADKIYPEQDCMPTQEPALESPVDFVKRFTKTIECLNRALESIKMLLPSPELPADKIYPEQQELAEPALESLTSTDTETPPSSPEPDEIYCIACARSYKKSHMPTHLKTKKHSEGVRLCNMILANS